MVCVAGGMDVLVEVGRRVFVGEGMEVCVLVGMNTRVAAYGT